jgi:bifunctional DNA-binding transcriptional regulator/antitoxin component of YhaV-PrlF toxin-antitoxin module
MAKGQITIPVAMRRALGITNETLLEVSLQGDQIVISKLSLKSDHPVRIYTDEEIAEFLEADKISPELAAWVQSYVKQRKHAQ